MPTNTNLLRARIVEKGLTQYAVASAIGISNQSLSAKINNRTPFKVSEIIAMCELLDINDKDVYFFAK